MGLISKTVKVTLSSRNIDYYRKLGYIIPIYKDNSNRIKVKRGTIIEVKIEDLSENSHELVNVKCDCLDCKNPYLKPMEWKTYKKYVKEYEKYYCQRCAKRLFGTDSQKKSLLKKSISFEQWCYYNLDAEHANEILSRWDAEKNGGLPSEVCYSSKGLNKKGYYFKCPKEIHESELKNIGDFTRAVIKGRMPDILDCNQCNSFGQYLIDTYGENALELYWDYERNGDINPYEISHGNNKKKIWVKCQEKDCCESYHTYCNSFYSGSRCPNCSYSKGERKIKELLSENNIKFTSQKSYKNLLGVGHKRLSYDFYLPQQNLLIEYQGQFHNGTVSFQSEEDFKKQQEHDRRKREYAKLHNIDLLEIWYWDYDNINTILQNIM